MLRKQILLFVMIVLVTSLSVFANPPTTYKATYSTTVHGVQYGIGLPPNFSTSKKYFICLSLSGSGPITHRIWAIGLLFGYGEEVGFEPIHCSIDYGTQGFLSESAASKDALVARFQQALTDIKNLYPNTYGIMGTSFSEGSSFLTHYNLMAKTENRIVALAPSSSGNVGIPTNGDKKDVKILFTCGSTDAGNLSNILKALPVYKSFGYNARLYVEQGQTHQVGEPSLREISKFFKSVSDSILNISTSNVMPHYTPIASGRNISLGNEIVYSISGRSLHSKTKHAPTIIINSGSAPQTQVQCDFKQNFK